MGIVDDTSLASGRVKDALDRDYRTSPGTFHVRRTRGGTESHINCQRYIRGINDSIAIKIARVCLSRDRKRNAQETDRQSTGNPDLTAAATPKNLHETFPSFASQLLCIRELIVFSAQWILKLLSANSLVPHYWRTASKTPVTVLPSSR
jgi:hypothetical protein